MKNALRAHFRNLRDALPEPRRHAVSLAIAERIGGLEAWRDAKTLLLYASFGSEVETQPLAKRARDEGKRILLPRMERPLLHLHVWEPDLVLNPNRHGIPEPDPATTGGEARDVDLVVVPGLAFDRRGGRLGYGGGYYDRLLATIRRALRVGVAFSSQVVDHLPSTHLDVPMDVLVTELAVHTLPRREH